MPTVANYVAVRDVNFEPTIGGPTYKFAIPQQFNRSYCVLSFMIRDVKAGEALELAILINEQNITTLKHNADHIWDRAIQEIFDGKLLKVGENYIRFMQSSVGNAKIVLSDIVVWFQENI